MEIVRENIGLVKGWVKLPRSTIEKLVLLPPACAKLLMVLAADAAWSGPMAGTACVSHRYLAGRVRMPLRDVTRALNKLSECHAIEVVDTSPMSVIRVWSVSECAPDTMASDSAEIAPARSGNNESSEVPYSRPYSLPYSVPYSLPYSVPYDLKEDLRRSKNNNNTKKPKPTITDEQNTPTPWPEAPSPLLISRAKEDELHQRFGGAIAHEALERIRNWLVDGNTAVARKARTREDHYATVLNVCKKLVAEGRKVEVES